MIFKILSGKSKPSARLPIQMPVDMKAVEKQAEDVPFDMESYKDTVENHYDFGFGRSQMFKLYLKYVIFYLIVKLCPCSFDIVSLNRTANTF